MFCDRLFFSWRISMNTQNFLDTILPVNFDPGYYFLSILVGILVLLAIGGIFRLGFGRGSVLNKAFSSAIAITSIYAIAILVYRYETRFNILFDALPFISVSGDILHIFPIMEVSFTVLCAEIVKMMILAFLMNLVETWLPKGKGMWSWFGFRFLAISIALSLHYCASLLLNSVLQEDVLTAAPLILFGVVMTTFLLACLKVIIGGILAFINPLLAVFYIFFFRKTIGKQLLRAILTTVFFCILVYALNSLSYTAISIATVAVVTYLPVILFGLALWFVIGKFL